MGFADRDYNRAGYGRPMSRRVGILPMWSVTTWLIVINVAVFVLNIVCARMNIGYTVRIPLLIDGVQVIQPHREPWPTGIGHFSVLTAIYQLQIWRFITFQFLHAGTTHLLFNMIALFFFGPLVESYLGARRYIVFYFLCGIAGAVTYVLLWLAHILIGYPWIELVGASAGIFGVLIAAAQIAPDATVLIYGIIPMRLRVMALVLLAVAAYTVIFNGHNAGGEAAHLGGAALGFALIRWPHVLDRLTLSRRRRVFNQV